MKSIKIKRVYEKPAKSDGVRIYVDRYWARGLTKEDARIDEWIKDIAPSDGLRKWYSHDPLKWKEFKSRYFKELASKQVLIGKLLEWKENVITLLFSSKEIELNNAAALKEFLEAKH